MKTPEDEAFDDLAKKQGMWGGGFQAKRAMAKDRIEEDDDIQDYKRPWVGLTDEDKQKLAAAQFGWEDLCLAVEAKLKEKNT